MILSLGGTRAQTCSRPLTSVWEVDPIREGDGNDFLFLLIVPAFLVPIYFHSFTSCENLLHHLALCQFPYLQNSYFIGLMWG